MTRWRYASATDTGAVRQVNQDALYVDDSLAVVADGMGGHAAGEVASAMTIDIVSRTFKDDPTLEGLEASIERSNLDVLADAKANPSRYGMGTTVIAVGLVTEGSNRVPTLFHVGDSRAYQIRDGAIRQLSQDHSVVEEWVRMGKLSPEEAAVHPKRHQLTRAIGVEDRLNVDVMSLSVQAGDRILLCSDGLTNELTDVEIAKTVSSDNDLQRVVATLVTQANANGGRDNISVVLVEFDEVTLSANPVRKTRSSIATPPKESVSAKPGTLKSRRLPRRRFGWRTYAFIAAGVAVVGGFFAILHWYAYSNYYVGDDNGTVAVFQGTPGGVAIYQPVKVLDTTFLMNELRPADALLVQHGIGEPTLEAALSEANYLHNAFLLSSPTTTTTTSKAKG
ncbi:MAG: Stp1/IreP family PP2C-type Ser/Thr phosphatase [Actinomycetota bacterium]